MYVMCMYKVFEIAIKKKQSINDYSSLCTVPFCLDLFQEGAVRRVFSIRFRFTTLS